MTDLQEVSLFSGIGGISLGLERAGVHTALLCEYDKHARGILTRHYPRAAIHNDVTELTADDCRAAGVIPGRTVLTAGFPCQDLSVAGKREGLNGNRSALFFHVARLLLEFRPAWVVLENVPGLLSADGPDDEHRCVCGWPYRWRGLHLSAGLGSQERGPEVVLGSGGSGDDGEGFASTGGVATGLRREDLLQQAGDREVGGSLLLEGPGCGGSLDAPAPGAAPEIEGGAGSARIAGGGDPAVPHSGRRADGSVDSGGGRALRDYPAEDPGVEREGSGSVSDAGDGGSVWPSDCEACGRPVGDRPNRPVVGSGFAAILRTLAELGYGIAYRILDARHFGVPQRRRRVVIVGRLGDTGAAAAQVLLEPEGVPGNPAAGIEPRQSPTGHAREGSALGRVVSVLGNHTHSLTAEGHDASEDGTGRGAPIVAFALRGREDGAVPEIHADGSTIGSLRAAGGGSSRDYIAYAPSFVPALTTRAGNTQDDQQTGRLVAFAENQRGELTTSDTLPSLKVGGGKPGQGYPAVTDGVIVRRLTPLECERLQGFPDGWTEGQADSHRSKQLGNSVAVPVFEWVGRRLVAVDREVAA